MNVKQLKDFRARLVYAKKLCAFYKFNAIILGPFINAKLHHKGANKEFRTMPDDFWNWYIHPTRTPAEREAMWDNSITAIDKRISKTK